MGRKGDCRDTLGQDAVDWCLFTPLLGTHLSNQKTEISEALPGPAFNFSPA